MMNDEMIQPLKLVEMIMGEQYFAVLSTVGDGRPYSNLVSYAITSDLKSVVFFTDRNTRKYRYIKDNHYISLLIDNRSNQPADIEEALAITITGTAREETEGVDILKARYLARYPGLSHFVENPESALIVVSVHEYIIAGFKRTRRIVID